MTADLCLATKFDGDDPMPLVCIHLAGHVEAGDDLHVTAKHAGLDALTWREGE